MYGESVKASEGLTFTFEGDMEVDALSVSKAIESLVSVSTAIAENNYPDVEFRLAVRALSPGSLNFVFVAAAQAMLLNAKNRTMALLRKLYTDAGVSPEHQALALNGLFADEGIALNRDVFRTLDVTYDKGTIAKKLGVYSASSGGKTPHAQAIGAIISQLPISENEMETVPYCRNGHDGVDVQYKESVIGKVRIWLEEKQFPNTILSNGKRLKVVYKLH